jgi:hypothetical protein
LRSTGKPRLCATHRAPQNGRLCQMGHCCRGHPRLA